MKVNYVSRTPRSPAYNVIVMKIMIIKGKGGENTKNTLSVNFRRLDYGRVILAVTGMLLLSVGIGMCVFANFGIAPFQSFSMGLSKITGLGISYGTFYLLLNLAMLLIPLFLDRKLIHISTFINIFLAGYMIDWTTAWISRLLPHPAFPVRVAFLIVGLALMCLSSAMYYIANLGVSAYDAIPLIITEKSRLPFRLVRSTTDLMCVAVGFFCGISIGVGTLATAFFMGPMITVFKNMFKKIGVS